MDVVLINRLIRAAEEHFRTTATPLPIGMNRRIKAILDIEIKESNDVIELKQQLNIYDKLLQIMNKNKRRMEKKIRDLESAVNPIES